MKRYNRTFEIKTTEEEAKTFCQGINKAATYYMRQNKPAYYTPWSSRDNTEKGFICWYYC